MSPSLTSHLQACKISHSRSMQLWRKGSLSGEPGCRSHCGGNDVDNAGIVHRPSSTVPGRAVSEHTLCFDDLSTVFAQLYHRTWRPHSQDRAARVRGQLLFMFLSSSRVTNEGIRKSGLRWDEVSVWKHKSVQFAIYTLHFRVLIWLPTTLDVSTKLQIIILFIHFSFI